MVKKDLTLVRRPSIPYSPLVRLQGKTAIITGAGTGIGRACALAMAREGASVALVGRGREHLEDTAREAGGRALAIPADLAQKPDIDKIVATTATRFGRIDILLNNAGVLYPGTAESNTEEEWDRTFNVNVRSVWLLSRAVLPHMRQAGGGSIINISSVLGLVGARNRASYAASKGAVTLLAKCMALDHAPDNIRVNCICPAFIITELTDGALNQAPNREAEIAKRTSAHPIGRLGAPEDIAGMAVYLASDESAWVTGASFPVDGGYTAV